MPEETPQRIGPHDMGGLPGDAVDRSEHDAAYWERQVDAMIVLMFKKGIFKDLAQLRRGIESLSPDVYEKLSYYERWATSAALNAVEQGIVTQEELDARIAAIGSHRESG
jgi:hypothetical protein